VGRWPGRTSTSGRSGTQLDRRRLAYVELLPDEWAESAIALLRRAVACFAARGVNAERLLTGNGSAFVARRYGRACRALGLRHSRTRPRRPRTNGKVERFIKTVLTEWAYTRLYANSEERLRRYRSGSTTTAGDNTAASAISLRVHG
jgi:hypothetical protein